MKYFGLTFAVIAIVFACQHANADIVFDLTGLQSDGAPLQIDVQADAGIVSDVQYDFDFSPIAPSWTDELEINVIAPDLTVLTGGSANGGNGPFDVEFGAPDNSSNPFSVLTSSALLNGPQAAGTWSIVISESFDDGGPDGNFTSGTITIKTGAAIPEPASAAILSMIGLGLVVRRRR